MSYYTVVTANTAVPGCETYPGAGTYCVGGSPSIVSVPAKKGLLTLMLTGLSALLFKTKTTIAGRFNQTWFYLPFLFFGFPLLWAAF